MGVSTAPRGPAVANLRRTAQKPVNSRGTDSSRHAKDRAAQPVGQIAAESEVLRVMLDNVGIDYWCHGGQTLEAACRAAGVDLDAVLRSLKEAEIRSGLSSTSNLRDAEAADLADYFVDRHQHYFRVVLPELNRTIAGLARREGAAAEYSEIRAIFGTLWAEIEFHILKEETVLFPLIGRRSGAVAGGEAIRALVRRLNEEHRRIYDQISRLLQLARQIEARDPEGVNRLDFLAELEAFASESRRHIHEEANVLYPRLLGAEN